MKIDRTGVIVVAVCVVALAWGAIVWWQGKDERGADVPSESRAHVRMIEENRRVRSEKLKLRKGKGASRRAVAIREKPAVLELEDDEERLLNDFSRQILRDLQAALDTENREKVSKLVMKMLEIPPDPKFGKNGVDRVLRRRAVEALGWFGASALPELVGMLADADPEIVQSTFDQFTLALEDISLSDYERADIVAMASKVLTDRDNLEMLFMEINNMRHSVGAGVLVEICLDGTAPAKDLMPEVIEFFTGEDNIVTIEDLEKWLQENPDGEDDDDLYGGSTE